MQYIVRQGSATRWPSRRRLRVPVHLPCLALLAYWPMPWPLAAVLLPKLHHYVFYKDMPRNEARVQQNDLDHSTEARQYISSCCRAQSCGWLFRGALLEAIPADCCANAVMAGHIMLSHYGPCKEATPADNLPDWQSEEPPRCLSTPGSCCRPRPSSCRSSWAAAPSGCWAARRPRRWSRLAAAGCWAWAGVERGGRSLMRWGALEHGGMSCLQACTLHVAVLLACCA